MAKVLVVDDDAMLRRMAALALKGAGHEVVAVDFPDAQAEIQKANTGNPFQVVLSDMFQTLRGGASAEGLNLAEWIQTNSPATKIVMQSGATEAAIIADPRNARYIDLKAAGLIVDFLSKPYLPITKIQESVAVAAELQKLTQPQELLGYVQQRPNGATWGGMLGGVSEQLNLSLPVDPPGLTHEGYSFKVLGEIVNYLRQELQLTPVISPPLRSAMEMTLGREVVEKTFPLTTLPFDRPEQGKTFGITATAFEKDMRSIGYPGTPYQLIFDPADAQRVKDLVAQKIPLAQASVAQTILPSRQGPSGLGGSVP